LGSFSWFCVFEVFAGWDLGHEANPKSATGWAWKGASAREHRLEATGGIR
jgi:hypothetical protein